MENHRWTGRAFALGLSVAAITALGTTLASGGFQPAWAGDQMPDDQSAKASSPSAEDEGEMAVDENGTPKLFTMKQAEAGKSEFSKHCALCHGDSMEGRVGPTLKGPNFARKSSHYTVGRTFSYVAHQMPGGNPGSLAKDQYEQIMSYILEQNGYPAGDKALTYKDAMRSDATLVSKVEAHKGGGKFQNIGKMGF